eukprot:3657072-Prymnesium_polylepis.2
MPRSTSAFSLQSLRVDCVSDSFLAQAFSSPSSLRSLVRRSMVAWAVLLVAPMCLARASGAGKKHGLAHRHTVRVRARLERGVAHSLGGIEEVA